MSEAATSSNKQVDGSANPASCQKQGKRAKRKTQAAAAPPQGKEAMKKKATQEEEDEIMASAGEDNDDDEMENDDEVESERSETVEVEYELTAVDPRHSNDLFNILLDYLPGDPNPDATDGLIELCMKSKFTTVLTSVDDSAADEDAHGVISLIDIAAAQKNDGLRFIFKQIEESDPTGSFRSFVDSHRVGFLVSERLVDIPILAAQLFVNLFTEYKASNALSTKSSPVEFDYFLMLSRVMVHVDAPPSTGSGTEPPKAAKRRKGPTSCGVTERKLEQTMFAKGEEYYCWKHRVTSVPFIALRHPEPEPPKAEGEAGSSSSSSSSSNTAPPPPPPVDDGERPFTLPFMFPKSALPNILRQVKLLDGYFANDAD